jgi:WhiB family redox-sensing transcriptional regulator
MANAHQLRHPANGDAAVGAGLADERWRLRASCRGLDPALFFPGDEEGPGAERAQQVCATCPVREQCLQSALAAKEEYGVWGGTTPRDRRRIVRRSRRTA